MDSNHFRQSSTLGITSLDILLRKCFHASMGLEHPILDTGAMHDVQE